MAVVVGWLVGVRFTLNIWNVKNVFSDRILNRNCRLFIQILLILFTHFFNRRFIRKIILQSLNLAGVVVDTLKHRLNIPNIPNNNNILTPNIQLSTI